jgi:hypothetical protein
MIKSEIPAKYRGIFERAPSSRPAAVRAKCLECMGYNAAEVKACTSPDCPLFNFRTGRYTGPPKGNSAELDEGGDE